MTQGQAEATDLVNAAWTVPSTVNDDVPANQDIWSFMYGQNGDGSWSTLDACFTATPGLRYPCTTGYRDLLQIVVATPFIEKSADRSAVVPGQAAGFSLTYSANVASNLPESVRSEEHTSELQSLMRISYAVFCLKKKKKNKLNTP